MKTKTFLWWTIFSVCAGPSIYLLTLLIYSPRTLGIDPIEIFLQETGAWALRFLLLSLACSPLRRLGLKWMVKYRRMLGLYSFYYASLHLTTYVAGWIEFDWLLFTDDILRRPFIYIGMVTWLLLAVLAGTSPKWMVKRLKQRWVVLHKGVFLAACTAWIHLWMQSRASAAEPLLYLTIIIFLLGERLLRKIIKRNLAKSKA